MSDLVIDCYEIRASLECDSHGIRGELDIEIRDLEICGTVFSDAMKKLSEIFLGGRREQIWFRCMFTGMLFRGVIRDLALDDSFRIDSGSSKRSLRIRATPIADSQKNPMSMVSGRLGPG